MPTLGGGKWAPIITEEPGIAVEPICLHQVGWSSAPSKCLVEFPRGTVRAYTTRGFAAGTAGYYYRFKCGAVSYYTAQESELLLLRSARPMSPTLPADRRRPEELRY